MLIVSQKAVTAEQNWTKYSEIIVSQYLKLNCTALMEEDGKEVTVQCESDKSVGMKYQNKALDLWTYLFNF